MYDSHHTLMSGDIDVTTATAPGSGSVPGRPFRAADLIAGRFRVVREIAEGGMGIVYEMMDEKLNERRALKCAKPGYANRLPPEARLPLRVTHPNMCRVFEIHTVDTPLGPIDFLTMESISRRRGSQVPRHTFCCSIWATRIAAFGASTKPRRRTTARESWRNRF